MTEPVAAPAVDVDRNISKVVKLLLDYHEQSVNELLLAVGMNKSTMIRRRAHGGWSAEEVSRLAQHFDKPIWVFYDGPLALFRLMGEQAEHTFRRYLADRVPRTGRNRAA